MKLVLSFLLAASALVGHLPVMAQVAADPAGERKVPTLGALKLGFDIDQAELARPLKELDKLYGAQLEKLGEQWQERGTLEALIAVRVEQARIEGRKPEAKGTDFPELVKIRSIYEKSKAERTDLMHQRLLPVIARYREQLEALRTGQTRQNLLEDAIRTNEELTKITALEAQVRGAQANPEATVFSPALADTESHALKVKVQVDGKSRLLLKDGKVWFDHTQGRAAPPGRHGGEFPTHLNDKTAWMPVWKGAVTEPFATDFVFSKEEALKVRLRMSGGRGIAEVIQQPSAENDHTVIVELRDEKKDGGMFMGSDWLEFRLTW